MKKKIHRIWRLREMGLNVPDYVPITSDLEVITYFNRVKDRVSIRSQPSTPSFDPIALNISAKKVIETCKKLSITVENSTPPHAPNLDRSDAISFCNILLRNSFHALVCPMVDWRESVWAGAAIRQDGIITLEIAKGPCMVRKVTEEGKIDFRLTNEPGIHNINDNQEFSNSLSETMFLLEKILPEGMTVELSYYKNKVGINNENLLFWDGYFQNEGAEGWAK